MAEVALRPVEDADLDGLFDQMRDPESVQMAAFIGRIGEVTSMMKVFAAGLVGGGRTRWRAGAGFPEGQILAA